MYVYVYIFSQNSLKICRSKNYKVFFNNDNGMKHENGMKQKNAKQIKVIVSRVRV